MEAELIEDVRVAPVQQILALTRRQCVRLAPCDIRFGERGAEGLEGFYDIGCELLQRPMKCLGKQSEERPKLADDNRGDFEGRRFRGERGKFGKQIGFAHAFGQVKGRLERRVKAVSPGIGRQSIQFFRRKIRFGRSWMFNPGEGIASQPSRRRLAQRCVGAGCEVKGVTQGYVFRVWWRGNGPRSQNQWRLLPIRRERRLLEMPSNRNTTIRIRSTM